MADADELERDADREEERAGAHTESAELLRKQAEEQREDQRREEEAHED
ncbi:MAG TPA: hypothetical protein VGE48_00260 [Candidatus Paceibacterota bacterium]